MHHSVRVQRRQRPEELAEDLQDLIRREDTARLQQLLKCDSIHIVPYDKVDVPVGESADLSGQDQVVMNQLDRSPRKVQELGPDLRRVDQLRAEHSDHDVELAGFVARQVSRGAQPLAQGFLDLVRAVRLAEQLSNPLEIQGLLLPLQQKDRPVTLVALEQGHQPVEQGDDLAMGLERGQSIEHGAELFGVAVQSENFDEGRHLLPADRMHDLLGPRCVSPPARGRGIGTETGIAAGCSITLTRSRIEASWPTSSQSIVRSISLMAAAAPCSRQSRSAATTDLARAGFGRASALFHRGVGEIDTARPDRAAPRLLDHPQRTGIAFHGLGHVLKQLGDADPAVAVAIARASDAIKQVIGKEAVLPRLRFQVRPGHRRTRRSGIVPGRSALEASPA